MTIIIVNPSLRRITIIILPSRRVLLHMAALLIHRDPVFVPCARRTAAGFLLPARCKRSLFFVQRNFQALPGRRLASRQKAPECAPFAYLAVHSDSATALLHDAVDR